MTHISRVRLLVVGAVAVIALVAAGTALSSTPASIQIDAGLTPHMSGADVVALAQTHLAGMSTAAGNSNVAITSAHLVRGTDLATAIKNGPILSGDMADAHYWIVRGTGTWVASHGRGTPKTAPTGFFIIDDATGEFVGMGMP
jgi:hypothetical protein